MVGHTRSTTDDESTLMTRRRAVASVAAAGVGGIGLLTRGTDSASAQVTMGELTASGDEADLSRAPEAVTVSAQGEWRVAANGGIEQVQLTLQAIVGDEERAADVAMNSVFDATEGDFALDADLIADHPDVSGDLFVPDETGATKTTPVRVAVIVSAVRDGEITAEARAEDTADVVVNQDGVEVTVGGSAEITVDSA
jgi:hypothetical protein